MAKKAVATLKDKTAKAVLNAFVWSVRNAAEPMFFRKILFQQIRKKIFLPENNVLFCSFK